MFICQCAGGAFSSQLSIISSLHLFSMETLYVRNLNEKVSVNTLRRLLTDVFAKFGDIVQITAHKNLKMKGQAFVTFANKQQSATAMEELQQYMLFDRPISIDYAKTNSDNFHVKVNDDTATVKNRQAAKAKRNEAQNDRKRRQRELESGSGPGQLHGATEPSKKKIRVEDWKLVPPNKVLLLQNITVELDEPLVLLFEKYTGFIKTRFVKPRHLSFIEFESEDDSTACLRALAAQDIQKLGPDAILTYAKK